MTAAVGATVAAFTRFTQQSLEQERGVRRLSSTLARMGVAYSDVRGEIDEFAAAQQRATRFGDDETRASINRIAQLTSVLQPSIAELTRFAAISADVAEAREQDLVTTSNAIGRAVAGDVEMLARFMPAFRDTLREIAKLPDAADRGAAALDLLESEFQGAATALDPLDLALSRIRNGTGDLQEALGSLVRESPTVRHAMGGIADAIDDMAARVDPASDKFDALGESVQAMVDTGIAGIAGLGTFVLTSFIRLRQAALGLNRFLAGGERDAAGTAATFMESALRQEDDPGRVAQMLGGVTQRPRGMMGAGNAALLDEIQRRAESGQVGPGGELISASEERQIRSIVAGLRDIEGQRDTLVDDLDRQLMQLEGSLEQTRADIRAAVQGAGGGAGGGDGGAAPTRATGRRAPDSPFASAEVLHGQGVQRGMADLFGQQAEEDVSALRSQVDALGQTLFGVAATGFDAATAAVDSFAESTEASRAELETFFETAERGAPSMQSAFASLGHSIGDVTVRSAVLDEGGSISLESFKDSAVDALGAVAQTGFAELGQAMAGVETEKFSKIALRAIGTMATGIGSVMIAAGVPMLIPGLPPFFNPVQGAALIAAGGTLTAIGSALGAVGATGAGAAGGGGDGGFEGTGARDSAQRAATQRETPRTTVVQIGTLVTEDAETVRKLERDTQRQIDLGGLETVGAW